MAVERTLVPAWVSRTWSGGSPPLMWIREANSQSFKIGQFVYQVDGYATVVATDGVVILGMALADATNVTSGHIMIPVIVACDDVIYGGNIYHATKASAVVTQVSVGTKYGLYVGDNKVHVDIADTTNDAVVIVDRHWEDKGDDTIIYPRVEFSVIPAAQQFGAAGD